MFSAVDPQLGIPYADPAAIPLVAYKALPFLANSAADGFFPRVYAAALAVGYYSWQSPVEDEGSSKDSCYAQVLPHARQRCVVIGFDGIVVCDCSAKDESDEKYVDPREETHAQDEDDPASRAAENQQEGNKHVHHIFSFTPPYLVGGVVGGNGRPQPLAQVIVAAHDPHWMMLVPRASSGKGMTASGTASPNSRSSSPYQAKQTAQQYEGAVLLRFVSSHDARQAQRAMWSLLRYHYADNAAIPIHKTGDVSVASTPVLHVVESPEDLRLLATSTSASGDTRLAYERRDGCGVAYGSSSACVETISMQLLSAVNGTAPLIVDPLRYVRGRLAAVDDEREVVLTSLDGSVKAILDEINAKETAVEETLARAKQREKQAAEKQKQLDEMKQRLAELQTKLAAAHNEEASLVVQRASAVQGWNALLKTHTNEELEMEDRLVSLQGELKKRIQENKDDLATLVENESNLVAELEALDDDSEELISLQERRLQLVDRVDVLATMLHEQLKELESFEEANEILPASQSASQNSPDGARSGTTNSLVRQSPNSQASTANPESMHSQPRKKHHAIAASAYATPPPGALRTVRPQPPGGRALVKPQRSESLRVQEAQVQPRSGGAFGSHADPRSLAKNSAWSPGKTMDEMCDEILALRKLRASLKKDLEEEEQLQVEVAIDSRGFRSELGRLEERKLVHEMEKDMLKEVTQAMEMQMHELRAQIASMSQELKQRRQRMPARYYVQEALTRQAIGEKKTTSDLLDRLRSHAGSRMAALHQDAFSQSLRAGNPYKALTYNPQ